MIVGWFVAINCEKQNSKIPLEKSKMPATFPFFLRQ